MKSKAPPLSCVKCGRFIGKDGYPRAVEVDFGLWEVDPLCGPCGRKMGLRDLREAARPARGQGGENET